MNSELLQQHISHFLERFRTEPDIKYRDMEERAQRIAYYQSWTRERILQMTAEDIYEYMSKLWAMLIWGNKQYYIDKLILDNGIEVFKIELAELVWGNTDIASRWDHFRKTIKGLGPAMVSEILCHVHPNDCMIWNRRAYVGLDYLQVGGLPKYVYQVTGARYQNLCSIYKQIAAKLEAAGFEDTTLLSVDYFVWDELQVVDNLSQMHSSARNTDTKTSDILGSMEGRDINAISVTDEASADFIHNDVRDAIRDIGGFLGFDAAIEKKVAEGSKVDAIWESKIGNMGRIIYVFEVQTKGSIDSLLMNLMQSLNNPAVQGVIAVSDKEQIEKIRKRASTLGGLKERLRYWDYEEILKVQESLQFVNESINKLKLVPEGF